MTKRISALLLALLLILSCLSAAGEEDVYLRISDALYRIVLRTAEGDVTLGSGVVFLDRDTLLTTRSCCREGELYAIGTDGEHAIRAWEAADDSGAALMELETPSSAGPLTLANYDVQGLPYLFGTDADGNLGAAPLYQMRYSMYRGQTALLISAEEGVLPGAIAADEQGCIIGLVVAQQMEGVGMYTAIEPDNLYQAITGEQSGFLDTSVSWANGMLNVTWADEKRTDGSYLITLSGGDSLYYTSFGAETGERSMQISVPPGHTYYVQTQWLEPGAQEEEYSWSDMTVYTVPDAAFSMAGFTLSCHLAQFPAGQELTDPLEELSFVSVDSLTDDKYDLYMQAVSSYYASEEGSVPMVVELIAPDGQFYYEEMLWNVSPEEGAENYFAVSLNSLFADCAMFSDGGVLLPGEYRLRCAISGRVAAEYPFTVHSAGTQPPASTEVPEATGEPASTDAPEPETSGILTGVEAVSGQGLVKVDWSGCTMPEGAVVTVYFMYDGNPYYSYYIMESGVTTAEISTVPGRRCMVWVAWTTAEGSEGAYPWDEEQFIIVEAGEAGVYGDNGFIHVRGGLTLTANADPEGDGAYLPETAITREALNDPSLKLVFQTEDRYQVEAESLEHTLTFVLYTPEGCVFAEQGYYNFYPEFSESDLWVKDLSGITESYASFMGDSAWPAGEYVFGYYIDGQTVCETAFTLE